MTNIYIIGPVSGLIIHRLNIKKRKAIYHNLTTVPSGNGLFVFNL